MNSGLQCLSNTPELTKYFLFGYYRSDLNYDNPDGLQGKLALAYANLLREMWVKGGSAKVAPHALKKALGTRIARF